MKNFEIIIQLGAILAVVVVYWKSFFRRWEVAKRVVAAFIPTAILGLIFYKLLKKFLLGNAHVVLWSLFIGGLCLIVFDLMHKDENATDHDSSSMPYKTAILIGCFQSLALIPGVSRSAATIVGGLMLGIKRKAIVEFSFLLAVPTMLAATAYDFFKNAATFSIDQTHFLILGFVTAFVVALLSIKFLLHYIQHHGFLAFGVYRVLLPLFFWFVLQK